MGTNRPWASLWAPAGFSLPVANSFSCYSSVQIAGGEKPPGRVQAGRHGQPTESTYLFGPRVPSWAQQPRLEEAIGNARPCHLDGGCSAEHRSSWTTMTTRVQISAGSPPGNPSQGESRCGSLTVKMAEKLLFVLMCVS